MPLQLMVGSQGESSSLRDVHRRLEVFMDGGIVDCRRPMVQHPTPPEPTHRSTGWKSDCSEAGVGGRDGTVRSQSTAPSEGCGPLYSKR